MTTEAKHVLRLVEEVWIEASRERVFRALTDPGELVTWWSIPDVYATTDAEVDLRVGGRYRLSGWSRARGSFEVSGVYEVVDPPGRLVYTWVPDWDAAAERSRVEFELEERAGGTRVRVTHTGFMTATSRDEHAGGWPAVLARLKGHLTEAEAGGTPEDVSGPAPAGDVP